MLLGCIGDDFTGSSDLANTLAKEGMRVVLFNGTPDQAVDEDLDAGVVALKTRSVPVKDAVKQSLNALAWLQSQGCQQFFFKYCSTFDSTREGNIGPVLDALCEALSADKVIVCPAFPGTGRSLYQGHLFVNDVLLSESGMQNHPLTPMTDSDIRRWLSYQTKYEVGHVCAEDVFSGSDSIRAALQREHDDGKQLIVVDALRDADLRFIGSAARDLKLVSGGSGVAMGLPENFKSARQSPMALPTWQGQTGKCVVLSGSCSVATRGQLNWHTTDNPSFEVTVQNVLDGSINTKRLADELVKSDGIPVAYSSSDPDVVQRIQQEFGREKSAEVLENFFAELARELLELEVERLIVAGGETSGAVVEGLSCNRLEIGPEIDPGVPAMRAGPKLVLALKSGNFGAEDFFSKAAKVLGEHHHD